LIAGEEMGGEGPGWRTANKKSSKRKRGKTRLTGKKKKVTGTLSASNPFFNIEVPRGEARKVF